jgi:hypothetical protein
MKSSAQLVEEWTANTRTRACAPICIRPLRPDDREREIALSSLFPNDRATSGCSRRSRFSRQPESSSSRTQVARGSATAGIDCPPYPARASLSEGEHNARAVWIGGGRDIGDHSRVDGDSLQLKIIHPRLEDFR